MVKPAHIEKKKRKKKEQEGRKKTESGCLCFYYIYRKVKHAGGDGPERMNDVRGAEGER